MFKCLNSANVISKLSFDSYSTYISLHRNDRNKNKKWAHEVFRDQRAQQQLCKPK